MNFTLWKIHKLILPSRLPDQLKKLKSWGEKEKNNNIATEC